MKYWIGGAGNGGATGVMHFFPAGPEGRARLRTVCGVEKRVECLLRSNVVHEKGPLTAARWLYLERLAGPLFADRRLCKHCIDRVRASEP
jgi:hypothetical protein